MVTITAKKASSLKERSMGLIAQKNPQPLFLETRWGIHTFGMLVPIDIVVMNKENRIKSLKENLRPWSAYFWNPKYGQILELPSGSISKFKLQVGQKINIVFC